MASAHRPQQTLYTEAQLIEAITTLLDGVPITPNEIRSPTQNFAINFYQAVLVELGANKNTILQMQASQMSIITYNEMYSNIVPVINLYKAVNYFMIRLGITDFGVSDILNPEHKRNMFLMSAIMHFMWYCDGRVADINDHLHQVLQLKEQREKILADIEDRKSKINSLLTDRIRRGERMKEIKQLIEDEKTVLGKLHLENDEHIKLLIKATSAVKPLEIEVKKLTSEQEKIQEEISKLKDMVVEVPEELKCKVEQLEKKKEEVAQNIETAKEQLDEKHQTVTRLEDAVKNLEARKVEMTSIVELNKEVKSLEEECGRLTKKIDCLRQTEEDLGEKQVKTGKKRTKIREALEEYKLKFSNGKLAHKQESRKLESEYGECSIKLKQRTQKEKMLKQQIEEHREKIAAKTHKFENIKEAFEAKNDEITQKDTQLQEYYEGIVDKIKSIQIKKEPDTEVDDESKESSNPDL